MCRFIVEWDSGVVYVDGHFECKLKSIATNQKLLVWTASLGQGDWVPSPFRDGRDDDDVRAVTQKTATKINRQLKTIRVQTRNTGQEVRVSEKR